MKNAKPSSSADWAVLFDVDGTMVNNAHFHEKAWIAFGERHFLPIDSAYYFERIHSKSNEDSLRELFPTETSKDFVEKMTEEKEAIYREIYRNHIVENPGLRVLVEALWTAGIPCAAVSNAPPENMHMILDALALKPYLALSIALDGSLPGKPSPALYQAASEKLDVPLHRCIILEDSVSGFRAAEAAGAPYIVISGAAHKSCIETATTAKAVHRDFSTLSVETLRAMLS